MKLLTIIGDNDHTIINGRIKKQRLDNFDKTLLEDFAINPHKIPNSWETVNLINPKKVDSDKFKIFSDYMSTLKSGDKPFDYIIEEIGTAEASFEFPSVNEYVEERIGSKLTVSENGIIFGDFILNNFQIVGNLGDKEIEVFLNKPIPEFKPVKESVKEPKRKKLGFLKNNKTKKKDDTNTEKPKKTKKTKKEKKQKNKKKRNFPLLNKGKNKDKDKKANQGRTKTVDVWGIEKIKRNPKKSLKSIFKRKPKPEDILVNLVLPGQYVQKTMDNSIYYMDYKKSLDYINGQKIASDFKVIKNMDNLKKPTEIHYYDLILRRENEIPRYTWVFFDKKIIEDLKNVASQKKNFIINKILSLEEVLIKSLEFTEENQILVYEARNKIRILFLEKDSIINLLELSNKASSAEVNKAIKSQIENTDMPNYNLNTAIKYFSPDIITKLVDIGIRTEGGGYGAIDSFIRQITI